MRVPVESCIRHEVQSVHGRVSQRMVSGTTFKRLIVYDCQLSR